jgi:hypothetical protein
MPFAAKVNVFNTQIGSDQELMAGGDSEDGAVIANAANQNSACQNAASRGPAGAYPSQPLDAFNQVSFGSWQDRLTIAKKDRGQLADWGLPANRLRPFVERPLADPPEGQGVLWDSFTVFTGNLGYRRVPSRSLTL